MDKNQPFDLKIILELLENSRALTVNFGILKIIFLLKKLGLNVRAYKVWMDTSILNRCLSEDGYQPGWVSNDLSISRATCLSWAVPGANYYVVSQNNCSRLPVGVGWESISTNLIYKLHGWVSGLYLCISRAYCRVLYRKLAIKVHNDHNEDLSTWFGWELFLCFISTYTNYPYPYAFKHFLWGFSGPKHIKANINLRGQVVQGFSNISQRAWNFRKKWNIMRKSSI